VLAAAMAMPLLPACGGGGSQGSEPGSAPTPPPPAPPQSGSGFDRYLGGLPTSAVMGAWVRTITEFGIRRAGGPAEAATIAFAESVLADMGVEVLSQPVALTRWDTREGETHVEVCVDGVCAQYPAFPTLSSRVNKWVQGDLVRYQGGTSSLHGKVVLLDYPMGKFAPGALREGSDWVYDPDSDLGSTVHPSSRPQNSSAAQTLETVLKAGPAAVIAALDDFIDTPYVYGVHSTAPYDKSIPIVWVSPSSRKAILEQLQRGEVTSRVSVVSTQSEVSSKNVIGRLPCDRTDQIVLFGSHLDAPFYGATEDAAGVALVLAQAAYWSRVPRAERPFEFWFLLNSAHLLGSVGCEAFVSANTNLLPRVVLNVHLETPCQEFNIDAAGQLIDQGRVEPHWFYTSRNTSLQSALRDAVRAEDYRRTMMISPDAFRDGPPCDAKALWKAGVPLMAHISNPVYYTCIADTLDKLNLPSLEQLTRCVARTIWALQGTTAAQMRAGISKTQMT